MKLNWLPKLDIAFLFPLCWKWWSLYHLYQQISYIYDVQIRMLFMVDEHLNT